MLFLYWCVLALLGSHSLVLGESELTFMSISTFADSYSSDTLEDRVSTLYNAVSRFSPMVLCVQGLYDSNARALFSSRATQLFGALPFSPPPRTTSYANCGCSSTLPLYTAFSSCLNGAVAGCPDLDAQCAVSACLPALSALLTAPDATGEAQSCHACLTGLFQSALPTSNLTTEIATCAEPFFAFNASAPQCLAYGAHSGLLLFLRAGLSSSLDVTHTQLNGSTYLARALISTTAHRAGEPYALSCTQLTQMPELELGVTVEYYGDSGSWEGENAQMALELKREVDDFGGERRVVLAAMGCGKAHGTPGFPVQGMWESGCAGVMAEEDAGVDCSGGGEVDYCDWFFESNFMRECTWCDGGGAGELVLDHVYFHGAEVVGDPLYDDKRITPLVTMNAVEWGGGVRRALVGSMTIRDSSSSGVAALESCF